MEFFVGCIRTFIFSVILIFVVLLVYSEPRWLILIGILVVLFFCFAFALYKDEKKKKVSVPKNKEASGEKNSYPKYDDTDTVRRINTKLVGVTRRNKTGEEIQSILPKLKAGEPLAFVREYDNPHDDNAVAVYCGSSSIGYINRTLAEDIACDIDAGVRVTGSITAITGGGDVSYGCNIMIIVHE